MIMTKTNNLMLALGAFALVAIAMFMPHLAFAQATDLTGQLNIVSKQLTNVPKLAAMVAYVAGTVFAFRALFALKGFIESPDDNPITKVLGFAATGALLIMLPYIISIATGSLGANRTATQTSSKAAFTETGVL